MAQDLPLMPKATAVWLVDNTTLTFRQIADFTGLHELEISGIAEDSNQKLRVNVVDPIRNFFPAPDVSDDGVLIG